MCLPTIQLLENECYIFLSFRMTQFVPIQSAQMINFSRSYFSRKFVFCPRKAQQIFASKYITYLPTEDELEKEIQRQRRILNL